LEEFDESDEKLDLEERYRVLADSLNFAFAVQPNLEKFLTFQLSVGDVMEATVRNVTIESESSKLVLGKHESEWFLTLGTVANAFGQVYVSAHLNLKSSNAESVKIKASLSSIDKNGYRFGRIFQHTFSESNPIFGFDEFCRFNKFISGGIDLNCKVIIPKILI
jgi:hypothetical protein